MSEYPRVPATQRPPAPRGVAGAALLLLLGCTPLNGPHRDAGGDAPSRHDGAIGGAGGDMKQSADAHQDSSSGATDARSDKSTPSDANGDHATPVDSSSGTGCGRFPHGPSMVEVPILGHTVCVDSTEVTQAQYQQFLDANVKTTNQIAACIWNKLFAPSSMCSFDPVGHASFPVNGVDWCDATAYCQWAGKRLCGGPTGGLIETDQLTELGRADVSEWTAACSHNGQEAYPYGTVPDDNGCNTGEHMTAPVIVPVETMPKCNGGFSGLFDMVGNVHEWENACAPLNGAPPSESDNCWIRGGSYHDVGSTCYSGWPLARDYVDTYCDMGFRCCADR